MTHYQKCISSYNLVLQTCLCAIKSWTTKAKDKTRRATAFEIRFMRLLAKYAWIDYKGNNMEKYLTTELV